MNLRNVLEPTEYIGYLKGRIIALVLSDDRSGLREAMILLNELHDFEAPSDHQETHTLGGVITDANMRAIRDGLVRLEKKPGS